ncbi:hypothetical protein CMMCAS04_15165 [Clavibacter michiganensis subsp. michiganensis]|nr:hypothetical protein CMMCAS04_15165 [Clavibacter michiganensis subsp. michiganensis]
MTANQLASALLRPPAFSSDAGRVGFARAVAGASAGSIRWMSQFASALPWPPVWMSAYRRGPSMPVPSPRPCSVAMTSSPSRHFSSSKVPASQMVTSPPPYSPAGIVPSKDPYSSGWSSVCTARWFVPCSVGTPLGRAQLTSTPSCSSRKSQCSARAWCSWITKELPSEGAGDSAGTGSLVFAASRLDR